MKFIQGRHYHLGHSDLKGRDYQLIMYTLNMCTVFLELILVKTLRTLEADCAVLLVLEVFHDIVYLFVWHCHCF